jgi:hypothetical protein
MDADILGLRKSHPASGKNAAKNSGKEVPSNPEPAEKFLANEKREWGYLLESPRETLEMWNMLKKKLSCPVSFLCLGWRGQGTNCASVCVRLFMMGERRDSVPLKSNMETPESFFWGVRGDC